MKKNIKNYILRYIDKLAGLFNLDLNLKGIHGGFRRK